MISTALCSHLWETCSISIFHNRPNIASAAINRLKRFTDIIGIYENDPLKKFELSMKFKLEEAKIAHCDGDTTASVRTSKLIIRSIQRYFNVGSGSLVAKSTLQSLF